MTRYTQPPYKPGVQPSHSLQNTQLHLLYHAVQTTHRPNLPVSSGRCQSASFESPESEPVDRPPAGREAGDYPLRNRLDHDPRLVVREGSR
jgi:hypothetical protein